MFLLVEVADSDALKNILEVSGVSGLMISTNFAVIITPANKVDEIKKLVISTLNKTIG